MTAAAARIPISEIGTGALPAYVGGGAAASAKWFRGWSLAKNAAGYLVPFTTATGLTSAGIAEDDLDATGYADGDLEGRARAQCHERENGPGGDAFLVTDPPAVAYGSDNQTACKTSAGDTRSIMGVFLYLDPESGKPVVWVGPAAAAMGAAMATQTQVDGLAAGGTFKVDEWTNALAADATGLKTATATQVAPLTILAAAMIAGGLAELAARPRNLTFTTGGTAANAPASVVITGTDIDGTALTETLALSQSAGIDLGVKAFKTVTSVVYGAAADAAATVSIGFGDLLGLSKSIKSRAGRLAVIQEVAVGSVVTNGALVAPATSPPHGTYSPNAAPDGAKDYSLTYEQV